MTPRIVKSFIIAIVGCSVFAGLADRIFPSLFDSLNLTYLLSLSVIGLKHFLLWQPLTYLFLYPAIPGISAPYLINLAFSMFVLWRIGSVICFTKGTKDFLYLFFGSGIFAAIFAFIALSSSPGAHIYAGATPAIFAMLIAAIVLFPHMELMLFLTLPVKGKWLICGVLASTLLIDLSNGMLINFCVNAAAALFGYLYSILVWDQKSPFPSLWRLEELLQKFFGKIQTFHKSTIDKYAGSSSKVYDFRTGERVIDDNTFMDACLSKISSEGRHSLTLREKFRLWRISRKKTRRRS